MRIFLIFLSGVAIALSGCATKPVSTASASLVPEHRIINKSMTTKKAGQSVLIIKRDSGWNTSACSVRVFINGSPVADVRTSEKVAIYLNSGKYILSAIANGICTGGLIEESFSIAKGKSVIYRISYGSHGEFSLNPTAF